MKRKWLRYWFIDGYNLVCSTLSEKEIKGMELEHGRLIAKIPVEVNL